MPHVLVRYDAEKAIDSEDDVLFEQLREAIKTVAAQRLSVPEWQLAPVDFSITFLPKGRNDEMLYDLEVIIFAHDFPARVVEVDDTAHWISKAIKNVLEHGYGEQRIEFSVSVFLGPLGYKADEAFPINVTAGR